MFSPQDRTAGRYHATLLFVPIIETKKTSCLRQVKFSRNAAVKLGANQMGPVPARDATNCRAPQATLNPVVSFAFLSWINKKSLRITWLTIEDRKNGEISLYA